MSKPAVLYSAVHTDTGREYIGVTTQRPERRWRSHIRGKTRFGHAVRSYGLDAFDFTVEARFPTFEEAKIAERIAIACRQPEFNMTAGGDGVLGLVRCHSAEHRAKIAAALRGRKLSEAHKKKVSQAGIGRKMSDAHRLACSIAQRGRKLSEAHVRQMSESRKGIPTGRPNTDEAKAKISAANKGRKHTEQAREKMRAKATERAESEAGRAHLLAASAKGAAVRRKRP